MTNGNPHAKRCGFRGVAVESVSANILNCIQARTKDGHSTPSSFLCSRVRQGESLAVSSLVPDQLYFFAIKSLDEVPNTSGISNCPHAVSGSPFPIYLPVVCQLGGAWDVQIVQSVV